MENQKYIVPERIFFLDCARKYYTPEWIKKMILVAKAAGFNVFSIHFSEDMGLRLESKQYPWLAGGDHSLCVYGATMGRAEDDDKYITQKEMADIVRFAQGVGMEVIPSFDSPGHMNYAVKKYNAYYGSNISNYFHKHGKVELVHGTSRLKEEAQLSYSRGIDISNSEAVVFAKNLYTEYGRFFRDLGCTKFDIGGDELLGFGDTINESLSKWQNLEHWDAYAQRVTGNSDAVAYDAFILYMNEICALMKSLGYERVRLWNDDVYRDFDTGYTGVTRLDPDIDVQYWLVNSNGGKNTVHTYIDRGHKVLNFISLYTYYVLGMGGYHGATPETIAKNWNAYVFDPSNPENNPAAPNPYVLGGGYCLWSDMPAAETEDEVMEHVKPFLTACGKALRGKT
ncbi:MAG: family 20 glycosylhydrolase [Clostridia bacterium]|nr:family 20 glycosylhydrolase [Clostridia bacterium]